MEQKRILALGFFDGVHIGHGALLNACRELADKLDCQAGAVTFSSHPDGLVSGKTPVLINTAAQREAVMRQEFHMDQVITLPFDRAMMQMPWRDFFSMLREKYHAVGLVCGHDFRFGYRGQGSAAILREACAKTGMDCVVIPEQKIDDVTVSSTHIRTLIERGDMENAARFLGRPHFLTGEVVPGRHLGRKLGFPTANVPLPEGIVCPKLGVYACKAHVGGKTYTAVTNVGSRPTVDGHQIRAESWLLDFDGDLYGQELRLEFYTFLRPERKFDDLDALIAAVNADGTKTREYFEKN